MGIDKDLNAIARKVNKGKYINLLLYPLVNSILGLKLFYLAAKHNWKSVLEFLVKKGIKVNVRDRNGNTALHFASKNGHEEILNILLLNGAKANVNAQGEYDCTPLYLAVIKDNKRIVEILLKKQANIYLEVNYNNITMTALDIAQANKNKEIEQLLLSFIAESHLISE